MLLNYLFSHFLDEPAMAQRCDLTPDRMAELIENRTVPKASYIYQGAGQSLSFVSDIKDTYGYRFHLKDHAYWFQSVRQFDLHTEDRAREYFERRYDTAKRLFLSGSLGCQLVARAPHIPEQFDTEHVAATWSHFLNGVYGVCTKDGQPETIFLKQAGVMFIEDLILDGPGSLSSSQTALLGDVVAMLDSVEADFAPHERPHVSRQRCVTDVRAAFL
ncbi:DUF6058 family natural product biosynthesis protein [Actibacterium sp. 188UL27-1]|uniref:DUF6058 family natural product biosynthesis protein n=1 Tax=Actibacterium sp. 188UL27-1 TaxID=2786961 RepID=UPI00195EEA44|nr:DUF6058 family natural product biosynthesis protein [Actibacterium sp. 188UL27-1]MBM7066769.1 hypothetical protein [Actibacterium sp. 188UL27-1]